MPFSSFISLPNPLRSVKLNAPLSEWNIVYIGLAQVGNSHLKTVHKTNQMFKWQMKHTSANEMTERLLSCVSPRYVVLLCFRAGHPGSWNRPYLCNWRRPRRERQAGLYHPGGGDRGHVQHHRGEPRGGYHTQQGMGWMTGYGGRDGWREGLKKSVCVCVWGDGEDVRRDGGRGRRRQFRGRGWEDSVFTEGRQFGSVKGRRAEEEKRNRWWEGREAATQVM